MKAFFGNLKDLIARHKLLSAIVFLAVIVMIIMIYVFFNLFIGGSNKYGARLDGIESHQVSKAEQTDVEKFLKEKTEVADASVRIQGRIIYISIKYNREVGVDKAKEIAVESLTKITDDNKKFYDVGYFLTQVEGEDKNDTGFKITGNKSRENETISWIKS